MNLLLDTQVVLWSIDRSLDERYPRLGKIVSERASSLHVSAVTLWEIAIKVRLGKLRLGVELSQLPLFLAAQNLSILAMTADHALEEAAPDVPTRDPFDRLLIAQCQIEGLRLVTVDRALADHPVTFR